MTIIKQIYSPRVTYHFIYLKESTKLALMKCPPPNKPFLCEKWISELNNLLWWGRFIYHQEKLRKMLALLSRPSPCWFLSWWIYASLPNKMKFNLIFQSVFWNFCTVLIRQVFLYLTLDLVWMKFVEIWGLTHPYKTGLWGEDCLLYINSYQESYLSDVGLEFIPNTPPSRPALFGLGAWNR